MIACLPTPLRIYNLVYPGEKSSKTYESSYLSYTAVSHQVLIDMTDIIKGEV